MFNTDINNIYFRNNSVIALYKGGSLIWRKDDSPTIPTEKTNHITGTANGNIVARLNNNDRIISPENGTKIFDYEVIDLPLTSLYQFMNNKSYLTSVNLTDLDTSNVTNMGNMFLNCRNLIGIVFGDYFDTSSVVDMSYMFDYCTKLTSIDVSSFDTSNVTLMNSLFYHCDKLIELDLTNFNTDKVTNLTNTFGECWNLKTIKLGRFNMSAADGTTFYYCTALTNVEGTVNGICKTIDLSQSPLTNASAMVFINGLDTVSSATITLKKTTFDTLTDEQIAIATSKGWTVAAG